MAKKKSAVTHLMNNGERQSVKALYRTGVMSEEDARRHFSKVSDKRWNGMIKAGFIRKEGKYIFLGKEGKKYAESKMDMKYQYRTRKDHIKHDLKLNKLYLRLSEKQRETWKTETQIREEISSQSKYHEMYYDSNYQNSERKNFIPDATVYSESLNQEIVIEAVTEWYSELDKEMKQDTANCFYEGKIYMF